MPATGLLCAIGIFNLYSVLENKLNQKTLKKTYFILIFLLFASFLIGLNHIRNSDKLYKISLNKKEKRGNPELNFLLYKNLSKNDLVKDIFVFRDIWNLSLLPKIDHRFYSDLCTNLEKINNNFNDKKYYILIDKNEKTCSEQNLLFLNKLKKTKIFDHQNFIFFLIEN